MKILILRFSSIGDIVLTTPVLRCIAQQLPNAEIHYATKKKFASLLEANPYIQKIHLLEDDFQGFADAIAQEKFDHIIDLHSNLRTLRLRLKVRSAWSRFNKLNLQKWLYIRLGVNRLPKVHIVDRYMAAAKQLGVVYDGKGLDYHIPASVNLPSSFLEQLPEKFAVFVIGGTWTTKKLPAAKISEWISKIKMPVVLVGGPEDKEVAAQIEGALLDTCGTLTLHQSARLIESSHIVFTHDTGLMHVAAALNRNIVSIWGNTSPIFGMWPLHSQDSEALNLSAEVANLSCRPCSKIGYNRCPKGHFKCMKLQNFENIAENLSGYLSE